MKSPYAQTVRNGTIRLEGNYKRILILRSSGDLFKRAIRFIKERFSDASLYALIPEEVKDQVLDFEFEEVIIYNKAKRFNVIKAGYRFIRSLRKRRFDLILILYGGEELNYLNVMLFAWLIGKRKVAYTFENRVFVLTHGYLIKRIIKRLISRKSRILSMNKRINRLEFQSKRHRLFSMPKVAFFEITNRCNIRCVMCGRELGNFQSGDMSPLILRKCKPLFPFLEIAIPTGWGEPLLAKDMLFEILDLAKEYPRLKTNITTNGTLLNDDITERLVQSRLTSITISFDGATKETFEEIRAGADYDRIIENIKRINKIKELRKLSNPTLNLEFVAMRKNIEELPSLLELARMLDISSIIVVYLVVHTERLKHQSLYYYQELSNRIFEESKRKAQELGINLNLPDFFGSKDRIKEKGQCSAPWTTIYIRWNGEVLPCCFMPRVMGDLKTQNIQEIWNGEKYRSLRKEIGSKDLPERCRNCYGSEMDVNRERSHIQV
ncbi:MAG: SPASM domain-containing protein [bacterium]|nr:SPASM domain-containing protein [bacterium]